MISATIKSSVFGRETIERKKSACADLIVRQTRQRIINGGDDEYRFPPLEFRRFNGSKDHPLLNTGEHLYGSLRPLVNARGFGAATSFIGARVLQLGTVGKGGELPSIVPVRAKMLFIPISVAGNEATKNGRVMPGSLNRLKRGTDYIFAKKVDIVPRKYFRLSAQNKRDLMRTFRDS